MTESLSQHNQEWYRRGPVPAPSPRLSEEFLARLVAELDDETVRAIILRGSYARGDATPPYSDVDLTRIIQETAGPDQPKYYIWREGYLVSVSTHSYAAYHERLRQPRQAIFAVTGIQEARVLLDKDGAFQQLEQQAKAFQWEPLQAAANHYAGQKMMELTEIVLRMLKMLERPDEVLLAKMLFDIIADVTEAIAVQRGVLIVGQGYFHQVQEAVGLDSAWTHYQRRALGIPGSTDTLPSLRERAIAALRLYQETFGLFRPSLSARHREAIEPLTDVIEQILAHEEIR
jgi:hypothetical protein